MEKYSIALENFEVLLVELIYKLSAAHGFTYHDVKLKYDFGKKYIKVFVNRTMRNEPNCKFKFVE